MTASLGRLFARVSSIAILAGTALSSAFAATDSEITFHRDVVPVLQKNCQTCHRPGDIGPMPLLTYEQTRPWAKAIRAAVSSKTMPPWHADRRYGTLLERSLALGVRDRDPGAVGRDRRHARVRPPTRRRRGPSTEGWRIGTPDVVYEMPKEFSVPATGTVMYQWIQVPSGFTEDKWVQAVEVRPGNRAVVHHAVVYAREEGADWANGAPVGEFFNLFSLGHPEAHRRQHDVLAAARAGAPRGVRAGRRPDRAATRPGPA